ncbi:hypothetical protein MN116_008978 [Schistosoma mekongi]|uniref:Uncharacterized protein n=1 Tax=Schistosoma mekongi TaxID=38744 RepID=A0AAE1Z5H1_SCHME|nr:hypothetical protein MN116_008978 [Schistosoma mekongi]
MDCSFGEQIESPNKQKKKRKKKKRKRYNSGKASGTEGESNATTAAASGVTTPSKFEDNSLSPTSTYNIVKVNVDTKKLSLKISKRPTNDGSQPVFMVEQLDGGLNKKEKKKKRNREQNRAHPSHHGAHSKFDYHPSPVKMHVQQNELSVDLTLQTHNIPTSNNSLSTVTPSENCESSGLIPLTFTASSRQPLKDPQLDLSFITSEGLFGDLISANNLYQPPKSVPISSLPSTSAAIFDNEKVMASSNCVSSTHTHSFGTSQTNVFTTKPNMFYELLCSNNTTTTLKHIAHSVPNDLVTSNSSVSISLHNTMGSACNMMEFASSFLQNEIPSSNFSCNDLPLYVIFVTLM